MLQIEVEINEYSCSQRLHIIRKNFGCFQRAAVNLCFTLFFHCYHLLQVLVGKLSQLPQSDSIKIVIFSCPIGEFVMAIQKEGKAEIHGGSLKASKVIVKIVECVAAAIYVDCNFDLKHMRTISFIFFFLYLFPV